MNVSYFRTLLAVIEAGSFSAAARQLGLTQPAVSMHIQALEDYFGTKLIERQGRGLELTRAGELAVTNVQSFLDSLDSTRKQIDEMTGDVAGPVFLGGSTVPGDQLCPHLISMFVKRFPRVRPRLLVDSTVVIVDKLQRRELDLALVGAQPKDQGVRAEAVFTDEMVLLMHPSHRLAQFKEVPTEELYREPFISRAPGSGSRVVYERELAAHGIAVARLSPVLEVGTSLAAVNAVEAGLGVALVSGYAAEKSLGLGTAVAKRIAGVSIKRPFYLLTMPQRYGSRAVSEMASFFRSAEARNAIEGRRKKWGLLS